MLTYATLVENVSTQLNVQINVFDRNRCIVCACLPFGCTAIFFRVHSIECCFLKKKKFDRIPFLRCRISKARVFQMLIGAENTRVSQKFSLHLTRAKKLNFRTAGAVGSGMALITLNDYTWARARDARRGNCLVAAARFGRDILISNTAFITGAGTTRGIG